MSSKAVRLKPGKEASVLRRHPWIFSGAIEQTYGSPENGDTVQVVDEKGEFLAWGAFSRQSQIRVRIWSWEKSAAIDRDFLRKRLVQAIEARKRVLPDDICNAVRLVHGESDGLPGLVVDRYAETVILQLLSCGPEKQRELLADLLAEITGAKTIFERSDADVRALEGLEMRCGVLRGDPLPEKSLVRENGLSFKADLATGHKTGFYLDQRANRKRVRELAAGCDVLDCFCYSGGFTVNALAGGAAAVQAVDASEDSLKLLEENLALNGLDRQRVTITEGDVFHVLRKFRDQGKTFDLIVLDPPKFAPTSAQAEKAARGYKDINLLALKMLRPGGLLFTFSCSGGVSSDLFQKIVAGAALDAGVDAQILQWLHQDVDHPVALNFPEGAYLKGLVVRKG